MKSKPNMRIRNMPKEEYICVEPKGRKRVLHEYIKEFGCKKCCKYCGKDY